ncbi:hypothetical protein GLW20_12465 [Virgibacillus halodenitrificans]|nr:hypothetical protein [Virgibacillus halodenitrificans]
MKVLDVESLKNNITTSTKQIDAFQDKITGLQKAVRGIVSLEDSLKGTGGEAIRGFYDDCHQPLLIYMYQFLVDLEKAMEKMQQNVQTFESSSEGYIKQEYLENDVEEGLDKVKRVAEGLSDEANTALDEVKDIVTLTKIDPGELVKSLQTGKQITNNTLENLHELDRTQSAALEKVEKDLLVMKNYIEELSGKFKSGEVQVGEYNRFALETSETHNKMMGKIYPLEGALEKLQSNFSYIAPYMAMQLPHKMFPLSYRGHSVSKTPMNFDKIEASVESQQLAEQNKLSVQEEEAISKYLKNLDEKDVSFNADDDKQPDYGPITFWDKRKVVGGNSSLAGTPDGLAGYATMAYHYFTDDIATVMNSEAAINERALSGFFLLPTPFKLLKPLDDVAGAKKAADVGKVGNNGIIHPVLDNTRSGSALKKPDGQHGFNDIIDNYTPHAKEFDIVGGDGVKRKLYQIEGGMKYYDFNDVYNKELRINERITTVKDQNGIFEWIVDSTKGVTHRRFVPKGQITGSPNQRP